MIIRVKYGFSYNGLLYGWIDKHLYRLPCTKNKRSYPKLKLKKWGNNGYHVGRDKKSLKQLELLTVFINFEYQQITDKNIPF